MRRLVLFARVPRAGHAKTRLAAVVGRSVALTLYRAFVIDQLRFLRAYRAEGACDVELCGDGVWPADPEIDPWLRDVPVTVQGPGGLGARLPRCFDRTSREGAHATVILGADAPTVTSGCVDDAFERLESGSDVVVAPAEDGGYVLIGLRRPVPELFDGIPWGGPDVCRRTVERATAAGVRLEHVAPGFDVDDAAGLARLRRELTRPGAARRAPATRRALGDLDSRAKPVV